MSNSLSNAARPYDSERPVLRLSAASSSATVDVTGGTGGAPCGAVGQEHVAGAGELGELAEDELGLVVGAR